MKSRTLLIGLLVTLGTGIGLLVLPEPSRAAFSGENGEIAFVRTLGDGNFDIYKVGPDGSKVERLTEGSAFDVDPAYSPDGQRIAFSSEGQIHVMDSDGSDKTKLTDNQALNFAPAWSPDGEKIAFESSLGDGSYHVHTMNADGSGVERLDDGAAISGSPAWSPDGARIAFDANREGNIDIYTINSDGSAPVRLTEDAADDIEPSWSPDGGTLAFATLRNDAVGAPNLPPRLRPVHRELRRLQGDKALRRHRRPGLRDGPRLLPRRHPDRLLERRRYSHHQGRRHQEDKAHHGTGGRDQTGLGRSPDAAEASGNEARHRPQGVHETRNR